MKSALSKEPNMLSMEESDKSKVESPDLWLGLAAEDYVTTRVLIYLGLDRLGAYHMQQTVEKYLKAFILKHCNGEGNKYKTHNLRILLEQCQKKDVFFNEDRVKMIIDTLFLDLKWNKISVEDKDKFMEFLNKKHDISIEKLAKIDKTDNGREIKVVSINKGQISLKLNDKPDKATKATLTINCYPVDKFIAKKDDDKPNVYLYNFNDIRYPSKIIRNNTTKEILEPLDYFVEKIRELLNDNIKDDMIVKLQREPPINSIDFGFIGSFAFKDLGKFFCHENQHFGAVCKKIMG